MFGDSLLIAPIFGADHIAKFYLPNGTWTNFLTGEKVEGGRWIQETHDFFSIPFFVRPNSILPIGDNDKEANYDFANNVCFYVYELSDSFAEVYNPRGELALSIKGEQRNGFGTFELRNIDKPVSIILTGVSSLASLKGGKWVSTKDGVKICPNDKVINFQL